MNSGGSERRIELIQTLKAEQASLSPQVLWVGERSRCVESLLAAKEFPAALSVYSLQDCIQELVSLSEGYLCLDFTQTLALMRQFHLEHHAAVFSEQTPDLYLRLYQRAEQRALALLAGEESLAKHSPRVVEADTFLDAFERFLLQEEMLSWPLQMHKALPFLERGGLKLVFQACEVLVLDLEGPPSVLSKALLSAWDGAAVVITHPQFLSPWQKICPSAEVKSASAPPCFADYTRAVLAFARSERQRPVIPDALSVKRFSSQRLMLSELASWSFLEYKSVQVVSLLPEHLSGHMKTGGALYSNAFWRRVIQLLCLIVQGRKTELSAEDWFCLLRLRGDLSAAEAEQFKLKYRQDAAQWMALFESSVPVLSFELEQSAEHLFGVWQEWIAKTLAPECVWTASAIWSELRSLVELEQGWSLLAPWLDCPLAESGDLRLSRGVEHLFWGTPEQILKRGEQCDLQIWLDILNPAWLLKSEHPLTAVSSMGNLSQERRFREQQWLEEVCRVLELAEGHCVFWGAEYDMGGQALGSELFERFLVVE